MRKLLISLLILIFIIIQPLSAFAVPSFYISWANEYTGYDVATWGSYSSGGGVSISGSNAVVKPSGTRQYGGVIELASTSLNLDAHPMIDVTIASVSYNWAMQYKYEDGTVIYLKGDNSQTGKVTIDVKAMAAAGTPSRTSGMYYGQLIIIAVGASGTTGATVSVSDLKTYYNTDSGTPQTWGGNITPTQIQNNWNGIWGGTNGSSTLATDGSTATISSGAAASGGTTSVPYTVNLDSHPTITLNVTAVSAQWTLKIYCEDDRQVTLQAAVSTTGQFTYDLNAPAFAAGYAGTKNIRIQVLATGTGTGNTVTVSGITMGYADLSNVLTVYTKTNVSLQNNTVSAAITAQNNCVINKNFTGIAALYQNSPRMLLALGTYDKAIAAGSTDTFPCTLNIPQGADLSTLSLKVMFWDKDLKVPISDVKEYPLPLTSVNTLTDNFGASNANWANIWSQNTSTFNIANGLLNFSAQSGVTNPSIKGGIRNINENRRNGIFKVDVFPNGSYPQIQFRLNDNASSYYIATIDPTWTGTDRNTSVASGCVRIIQVKNGIYNDIGANCYIDNFSTGTAYTLVGKTFDGLIHAEVIETASGKLVACADAILPDFAGSAYTINGLGANANATFDNYQSQSQNDITTNFLAIGDSNTYGYHLDSFSQTYSWLLADHFRFSGVNVMKHGYGGSKSNDWRMNLLNAAAVPYRVDGARNIACMMIGTNDFAVGNTLPDTEQNIDYIVNNLHSRGWEVWFVTYPFRQDGYTYVNIPLNQLNNYVRADANIDKVIDLQQLVADPNNPSNVIAGTYGSTTYGSDNLHFSAQTNQTLYNAVVTALGL